MATERIHDVVIYGTGLAGLRAAVEIARKSQGEVDLALVSARGAATTPASAPAPAPRGSTRPAPCSS